MIHPSTNRWRILGLTALTVGLVIGVPSMSLSVLFGEISAELHLDLVQVGLIWGIGALTAIFTGFLSGAVIDRFGPKRVLQTGIVLVSLAAAARGLAGGFHSLLAIILVLGCFVPLVTTSGFKMNSLLFPRRQLGLANGIQSTGMASGLLLGSLFSASVFSPLLGGWRNVFLFHGGLALLLVLPWRFIHLAPSALSSDGEAVPHVPMRQALGHVAGIRNMWRLGLAFFGLGGCLQGIAGYLPLYLRGLGWEGGAADGALSLFNAASLVCILPIALLSDRLGSRKTLMTVGLTVMAAGTGRLSAAAGGAIWPAVVLAGAMRDGSASMGLTMAAETEGVGPLYAGTATGMVMTFFFIGNLLSPPVGNMLAGIAPGAPFVFWAILAVFGLASLLSIRTPSAAGRADVFEESRTGAAATR
jgi:MFS family permease